MSDDIEAHFAEIEISGVRIVEDLHETEYREWHRAALDLDGHH